MQKPIIISEGELPIMKVLWEKGSATSPEIYKNMEGAESKNKSTFKTVLLRLVQKGAVKAEEINLRNYMYYPLITKDEYVALSRKNFLERVFDGSVQNLLLNFIREEKVSKADVERLLDQIEED